LKNRELPPVGKFFIERARTVAASLAKRTEQSAHPPPRR
jgi:hypothetical protein